METERIELPVEKELRCDILVVGGGAAGLAAAVRAAQGGARVILAERNGCLGGTATSGLVGPFMSAMDPQGQRQVVYGFMEELIRRMAKAGGAIHPSDCKGGDGYSAFRTKGHIGVTPFSPESLKLVAEELCAESGVKLLYHALLIRTETRGGKLQAAYFATKGGVYAIRAKLFIDCSGDADLSAMSGVPVVCGDENGNMQAVSLFFIVDGVDKEKLNAYMEQNREPERAKERYFEREIERERERGAFPCGRHRVSFFESVDGTWRINMTQIDRRVDASDPEQVTAAEIECRRQIKPIMDFLKRYVPGFARIRLLYSAEMLGVRESRRIRGEYCLSGDDVREGRSFPDAIAFTGDSMDMHTYGRSTYFVAAKPTQIPYRCLLPLGVDNLLAAGRCLSADRAAHSAVRVMPPCFAMGEAAGTAAALALRECVSPKQVDITRLREALLAQGVYLG